MSEKYPSHNDDPDLARVLGWSIDKKLEWFRKRSPKQAAGFDILLDDVIRTYWRETFYNGPKGGLSLKLEPGSPREALPGRAVLDDTYRWRCDSPEVTHRKPKGGE